MPVLAFQSQGFDIARIFSGIDASQARQGLSPRTECLSRNPRRWLLVLSLGVLERAMTEIDRLIAQSETELRRARAAQSVDARDRHVMCSERLLDEAWRLNEADADLPPLESGLWGVRTDGMRVAA